jgi:drug/metabolite transporter (DMT)-like permease
VSRPAAAREVLVFALLTLIWGTTWAAIRVSLEGIPPFTGVALRFAIASVLLLGLMKAMGIRRAGTREERRIWLINATLSFAGSYGIVHWAEQSIPSGLASVLFATFPLFVAVLAHHALPGDRLTARGITGVMTGFAGVAVIFSEDLSRLGDPRAGAAALVMLGSPLVSAFASVAAKRWGAGIHPFSMTAVPMGIAAVLMGIVALIFERSKPLDLAPRPVAAVLYLALMGSALTFSLYYWLLARIAATRVALMAFTIPVVAVLFGALVMQEPVTTRTLAGGALVIAGVAMAVWRIR